MNNQVTKQRHHLTEVTSTEPECLYGIDHDHHWVATVDSEGGCAESPGTFSTGDNMVFRDHCKHCRVNRKRIKRGPGALARGENDYTVYIPPTWSQLQIGKV